MTGPKNLITVSEHDRIYSYGDSKKLTEAQLEALQRFYGKSGVPYYDLIHRGIRFNEYVGILMVGRTVIEVLPKTDVEDGKWRMMLIDMLRVAGIFDFHAPSRSSLKLKANSILDLYFEIFISEVEYLLHAGLIKKYRKICGNRKKLKGSIHFPEHIKRNIIHKERFFVSYTVYDKDNLLNQILYKALKLLDKINTNIALKRRIRILMLCFPKLKEITVTEESFKRIKYDRKSIKYREAIEIAKLMLMNSHPDIRSGKENILALMFDMNLLWERFIFSSLKRYKKDDMTVLAQKTKKFWKAEPGRPSTIRPDIVLKRKNTDKCIVLDTKWKNIRDKSPSPNDLRQMYVYLKYYGAHEAVLVYPGAGDTNNVKTGKYYDETNENLCDKACNLISIRVQDKIREWQKEISDYLIERLE